jgi:hypothetical protein
VELNAIRALTDARTKLVLVNSPHNPTGATFSDVEMQSLHDFLAARGIQFVVNKVYHPIYYGPTTASAARLPHATVVSDFPKALCLAWPRTGWLVESDRKRMSSSLVIYFGAFIAGTKLPGLWVDRLIEINPKHTRKKCQHGREGQEKQDCPDCNLVQTPTSQHPEDCPKRK